MKTWELRTQANIISHNNFDNLLILGCNSMFPAKDKDTQ